MLKSGTLIAGLTEAGLDEAGLTIAGRKVAGITMIGRDRVLVRKTWTDQKLHIHGSQHYSLAKNTKVKNTKLRKLCLQDSQSQSQRKHQASLILELNL